MSIAEVAQVILVLAAFGVIVYVPKFLIDVAWEREGRWLTVAWVVNVLCMVVAVPAGGYALIVGAVKLSEKSWPTFLVSAGALAFVIYFYVAKGRAKEKTELTPKLAAEIIEQYADAMARGTPDGGIARYESYLPCSKDRIKQACKLSLAFLIEHHSLKQEYVRLLLSTIAGLSSFVPDEKAKRINANRTPANEEYRQFSDSMIGREIRREMDEFIEQVEAMDTCDPLFHQRVYTLIGLEYFPSVKQKFSDAYWDARN